MARYATLPDPKLFFRLPWDKVVLVIEFVKEILKYILMLNDLVVLKALKRNPQGTPKTKAGLEKQINKCITDLSITSFRVEQFSNCSCKTFVVSQNKWST